MTYTDGIHLIADNIYELHIFAKRIGLNVCWFESKRGKNHPHYDLYKRDRARNKKIFAKALECGAKHVTAKQIVIIIDYLKNRDQYSRTLFSKALNIMSYEKESQQTTNSN